MSTHNSPAPSNDTTQPTHRITKLVLNDEQVRTLLLLPEDTKIVHIEQSEEPDDMSVTLHLESSAFPITTEADLDNVPLFTILTVERIFGL